MIWNKIGMEYKGLLSVKIVYIRYIQSDKLSIKHRKYAV